MGKTTKAERQAFDALEDAAGAAKIAKKVAKDLSGKQARKLRAAASDAFDVAETSKKAVRKHPTRVRKEAEKATDVVLAATDKALRKVETARADAWRKKAEALEAERRKAERKAAKKAAKASVVEDSIEVDDAELEQVLQEVLVEAALVDALDEVELEEALDELRGDEDEQLVAGLEMVDESELEALEKAVDDVREEARAAAPEDDGVDDETSAESEVEVELAALTVVVLRARARDAGYAGYSRLTKAQLIELLS